MRPARRRRRPTFRALCEAYPHATGRQARDGRAAGARQVCLRKKPINPRPSHGGPGTTACCLFGHAHTRTRTHTGMCTCVVVLGHGVRACANRARTGHSRFRYARLPRHAQGTPVPWETRAHRKRSMPARKTSTNSTVVVCHRCGIAFRRLQRFCAPACAPTCAVDHLPPHVLVCAARLPVLSADRIRLKRSRRR